MDDRLKNSELMFCEYHAAAQSLKNGWTRLASTYGCMMIVLSGNRLLIKPHWFAGWLITLLCLDLNHEISISDIRDVKKTGKWFSYSKVEIHFRSTDGTDKRVLLYLKKSHEFIDKLTSLLC